MPSAMRRATHGALDFLFPDACLSCGVAIRRGRRHLCEACAGRLATAPGAFVLPGEEARGGCARALYAAVYQPPLSQMVRALKYGARPSLAAPLAGIMARAVAPARGSRWLVVPVPLHRTRRRERGYNQAALIALALADTLGLAAEERLLLRRRPTRSQTTLARAERLLNVADAFVAAAPLPSDVPVLLVDDVVTTGATLAAARRALLDGGATVVVPFAAAGNVAEREGPGAHRGSGRRGAAPRSGQRPAGRRRTEKGPCEGPNPVDSPRGRA